MRTRNPIITIVVVAAAAMAAGGCDGSILGIGDPADDLDFDGRFEYLSDQSGDAVAVVDITNRGDDEVTVTHRAGCGISMAMEVEPGRYVRVLDQGGPCLGIGVGRSLARGETYTMRLWIPAEHLPPDAGTRRFEAVLYLQIDSDEPVDERPFRVPLGSLRTAGRDTVARG